MAERATAGPSSPERLLRLVAGCLQRKRFSKSHARQLEKRHRREPLSARERPTSRGTDGAAVAGALTLRRGNAMALRNRYATAALLAALVLALVALAGCGQIGTTPRAGAAATNTVTASGAGTTQAVPDTAEMSFGVTTTSANAKTALDEASKDRRADRLRGQEAGRRRRGHPDAGRQRLPADRRPERQAGHHRLPGVAQRDGQGTRHLQARRDHLCGERRRRQRHQRAHVHR